MDEAVKMNEFQAEAIGGRAQAIQGFFKYLQAVIKSSFGAGVVFVLAPCLLFPTVLQY